ncbi:hypothetical protein [Kutzneria chonburiensis]|uniref:Resolvase/invertase-type recombinase catalytic domain-containing protein n=1 Tax=Kutzneria chonburiensis TaxID=1483604 RepID=A0ABV6N2U7_9PSEU|nr:hypothetical protein [Kutzneria chonburiensis]
MTTTTATTAQYSSARSSAYLPEGLRRYCDVNGLTNVVEYHDGDGFSRNRGPRWADMLCEVAAGNVAAVVLSDLPRLGEDCAALVTACLTHGTPVHIVSHGRVYQPEEFTGPARFEVAGTYTLSAEPSALRIRAMAGRAAGRRAATAKRVRAELERLEENLAGIGQAVRAHADGVLDAKPMPVDHVRHLEQMLELVNGEVAKLLDVVGGAQ